MMLGGKIYHPGEIQLPDYGLRHDYWIAGYGRSGTKWLRRMLLDTLGLFDREHAIPFTPRHIHKVGLLHWHIDRIPGGGGPAIYLHRDPRDVIVSMSRYWLELGGVDGVLDHQPLPAPPPLNAINQMHRYWSSSDEIRMGISYSDLVNDTEGSLRRIYDALGIEQPEEEALQAIVEYHGFDHFIGMLKQTERYRITKYIGPRIGAWKEALTRAQGKRIHEGLWIWLKEFRYESDAEWWRDLPLDHPAN